MEDAFSLAKQALFLFHSNVYTFYFTSFFPWESLLNLREKLIQDKS